MYSLPLYIARGMHPTYCKFKNHKAGENLKFNLTLITKPNATLASYNWGGFDTLDTPHH